MTNQEIHDALWEGADIYGLPSIYKVLANNGVPPDKIDDMVDEYYEWINEKNK